jgi:hypothetical protein
MITRLLVARPARSSNVDYRRFELVDTDVHLKTGILPSLGATNRFILPEKPTVPCTIAFGRDHSGPFHNQVPLVWVAGASAGEMRATSAFAPITRLGPYSSRGNGHAEVSLGYGRMLANIFPPTRSEKLRKLPPVTQ